MSRDEFTYTDPNGNVRDQTGRIVRDALDTDPADWGTRAQTNGVVVQRLTSAGGHADDPGPIDPGADGDHRDDDEDPPSSWTPVDLSCYLDGSFVRLEPAVLFRADGVGLLYPGRIHWAHGESESGKSWLGLIATVRVISTGGTVLYIDHESDPAEITARLLALGATPADVLAYLVYLRPGDSSMIARNMLELDRLLSQRYVLGIIDGVTDGLGLDRASSKDTDEVAGWIRRMPRRIASATGAAVLAIDQVSKDSDSRGRFAIGSQHKLAGVDGAAFVVEPSQPLGKGLVGEIVLRIAKDRPGALRRHGGTYRKIDRTQEIARITFDAIDPEAIEVTISGPSTEPMGTADKSNPEKFSPATEKMLQALRDATGPRTAMQLVDLVAQRHNHGLKRQTASASLNALERAGLAEGVEMGTFQEKQWVLVDHEYDLDND